MATANQEASGLRFIMTFTHLFLRFPEDIFSDAAVGDIFQFSRGIARLVNKVFTSSLIYGAQKRKSIIDDRMAKLVIDCKLS